MNINKPKQATTISLPGKAVDLITKELAKKFGNHSYPIQYIILLCLRKYLYIHQLENIDSRSTCRYNMVPSRKQVKIYLTAEEHHNVKMYRLISQQSVSYICFLAINEFLLEMLEMLCTSENQTMMQDSFDILSKSIQSIHRTVYFKEKNIIKLVIVIPHLHWNSG